MIKLMSTIKRTFVEMTWTTGNSCQTIRKQDYAIKGRLPNENIPNKMITIILTSSFVGFITLTP